MARFRRSFSGGRGRKATNYGWALINDTQNAVAASSSVLLGSLTLNNQGIDETLLRVVGMISVASDQEAATEQQEGAFGMMVVKDNAIVAGVSAIPTPLSEGGDDQWIVWVPFLNEFAFITGSGFDPNGAQVRYFDFKSKRIVHTGESIALVVASSGNSEGFRFSVLARVLSMVRGT